jgi:hypothetical protein
MSLFLISQISQIFPVVRCVRVQEAALEAWQIEKHL